MKFIINADGFGRTRGVTDSILRCVDNGVLSGISILSNGDAFDYAVEELKKKSYLRVAIHLNLFDGRPVSEPEKIPTLVDANGYFRQSFMSLWMKYVLSNASDRRILKQQVKLEIFAQISKVLKAFGRDFHINITSVDHMHMIPFVFDGLFELSEEFKYSYIRIPREPFFIYTRHVNIFKTYLSLNITRNLLLRFLSMRQKRRMLVSRVRRADHFIGVLFKDDMSFGAIKKALVQISKSPADDLVEIAFNPGRALSGEEACWPKKNKFMKMYYSRAREKETELLQSDNLKDLLARVNFVS